LTLPTTCTEKKEFDFRRARHKELYDEVNGNIMYCAECDKTISTVHIVNNSLKRWRDTVFSNQRTHYNRPDTNIPLSPARLDMAAYTFSYHMNGGCALEKDCFWGNMHVREMLLKHRFKEHSSCHSGSCFKIIKRIKWVLDEKIQQSSASNCNSEDTSTTAIAQAQIYPSF
jgi:hypothetical protein